MEKKINNNNNNNNAKAAMSEHDKTEMEAKQVHKHICNSKIKDMQK